MKAICFRVFLFFILLAGASLPAHALRIKNMDKEDRTVTVVDGGEGKTLTLKPYETFYTPGRNVKMTLAGEGQKTVRGRSLEEFAIFDNEIVIQRADERGSH